MSLPTTGVLLEANDGDSKPEIGLVVIGGLSSLSCRSPAPRKLFGFRSDWTAVSVVEEKVSVGQEGLIFKILYS